ncbi:hypothetical protein HPB47_013705 [Ixodes persulcatus]|uniref:Uncharacterized protein n=1 Tax=Ixodes persulcatus TaxID=34615 RepID=A0AC60R1I5_IXOPE|nr:hypothetical protein HPB47_013705 [Ixodes persulcatus]
MDFEGPKVKKPAKPKKKPQKISTTKEEDAGGYPGPSNNKKGRPETDGKGQTLPKEINNQIENIKTALNPTPQEATLREQIGKAQTIFIHTIAAVEGLMDEKARANLAESFQTLKNIDVQLIEQNSYLKGRLAERPQEGPKSYLEAALATASDGARIRETGLGDADERWVDVDGAQTPAQVQKSALLIYPTNPKPNSEYSQVMEALRAAIAPEELKLSDLETRRIKGGALIASTSGRNQQILVKGISITIDDLALKAAIINQNHLNGTLEDIKVARTFPNRDGTKTVVFEVQPEIFKQLKTKRRLIVGWTSCPVEENLHVLFCRRCSRYGHTTGRCQERPRCIHCGKDHSGADCDERSRRTCLACKENPQVRPTDTEHSSSDADCPTYLWYVARLHQKINYG